MAELEEYIREIKIAIPDMLPQGLTHTQAAVATRQAEVVVVVARLTHIQAALVEEYQVKAFRVAMQVTVPHTLVVVVVVLEVQAETEYRPMLAAQEA